MKKRLVTLLAGLLTVLSMGFGLAQFSDVPAGHWAKEAVEALAAKGINTSNAYSLTVITIQARILMTTPSFSPL